jgi:hypothetical protein
VQVGNPRFSCHVTDAYNSVFAGSKVRGFDLLQVSRFLYHLRQHLFFVEDIVRNSVDMLAEQIFTPFGITEYNGYIIATDIPVIVDIAGRECHRQDDETNEENKRDPPERPAFRTNLPFIIYIFQVARFLKHKLFFLLLAVACPAKAGFSLRFN